MVYVGVVKDIEVKNSRDAKVDSGMLPCELPLEKAYKLWRCNFKVAISPFLKKGDRKW